MKRQRSQGLATLETAVILTVIVLPIAFLAFAVIDLIQEQKQVEQFVDERLSAVAIQTYHLGIGTMDFYLYTQSWKMQRRESPGDAPARAKDFQGLLREELAKIEVELQNRFDVEDRARYKIQLGLIGFRVAPDSGQVLEARSNWENCDTDDCRIVQEEIGSFAGGSVSLADEFKRAIGGPADISGSRGVPVGLPSALHGVRRQADYGTSNVYQDTASLGHGERSTDPLSESNYHRVSALLGLAVSVDYSTSPLATVVRLFTDSFPFILEDVRVATPRTDL